MDDTQEKRFNLGNKRNANQTTRVNITYGKGKTESSENTRCQGGFGAAETLGKVVTAKTSLERQLHCLGKIEDTQPATQKFHSQVDTWRNPGRGAAECTHMQDCSRQPAHLSGPGQQPKPSPPVE